MLVEDLRESTIYKTAAAACGNILFLATSNALYKLSVAGEILASINLDGDCSGLAMAADKVIILIDNTRFARFSKSVIGTDARNFQQTDVELMEALQPHVLRGNPHLQSPCDLAATEQHILVADRGLGSLCIFTTAGTL